ncbi:uncharacterized protein LOC109606104 isoform X2 [Aethina tumida]|uniref:uncharacterized protein LOC109606104 isoform X2 n=1 Tax=Aethina tumida TaxID=116153 RepID=UPI002147A8A7|nr:uncharacterized protein LOC109606104 isoform X2 [Aethina tumida]
MSSVIDIFGLGHSCPDPQNYVIYQHHGQLIVKKRDHPHPGKNTEIYIKGLPKSCTIQDLFYFVESCGTVYQVRLLTEYSGYNRGYAYVSYVDPAEAKRAICLLNGQRFLTNVVTVKISTDNDKLTISNLPGLYALDEIEAEVKKQFSFKHIVTQPMNLLQNVIIQFDSHRHASDVRKMHFPHINLFGTNFFIDWAIPVGHDEVKHLLLIFPDRVNVDNVIGLLKCFAQATKVKKLAIGGNEALVEFLGRQDAEELFIHLQDKEKKLHVGVMWPTETMIKELKPQQTLIFDSPLTGNNLNQSPSINNAVTVFNSPTMVNSPPENNQIMYDLMCCFPFQVSHNGIYNFVQRRMDMNRVIHVLVYELFVTICLYTEEEALYILKELAERAPISYWVIKHRTHSPNRPAQIGQNKEVLGHNFLPPLSPTLSSGSSEYSTPASLSPSLPVQNSVQVLNTHQQGTNVQPAHDETSYTQDITETPQFIYDQMLKAVFHGHEPSTSNSDGLSHKQLFERYLDRQDNRKNPNGTGTQESHQAYPEYDMWNGKGFELSKVAYEIKKTRTTTTKHGGYGLRGLLDIL